MKASVFILILFNTPFACHNILFHLHPGFYNEIVDHHHQHLDALQKLVGGWKEVDKCYNHEFHISLLNRCTRKGRDSQQVVLGQATFV